jgi:hypothetical protein
MNGALPQNQFQNLSHSPDQSGNRPFFIVCSAALDEAHSSVHRPLTAMVAMITCD